MTTEKEELVCWINEQKKIISFHFEKEYIRKEFVTKSEFRDFTISMVSIGYKIQ